MAAWLFGVALMLVTEGAPETQVVDELLAESGGNLRMLEGAYGRAVALVGEFPDDPKVRQTVDLLAKALRRSRMLLGSAQPA